ncbi:UDENN FNIP1/2-type domain-containing protein [Caenorhabditis elegans]|uniref:UDENN FNIP1/2-type domain-containing protein n=1 Tax=Caenorhabditis elegans TaxID=6239 RepID=H2L0I9_CAEEL|nr:UDENN FNIP1/2-type domain-containing protein [Caenorhabditis elegans]CCD73158.1 UDENN FNIP1/2-type domain-containing protein [Caenorhabditis elegans]|eukprot:NP_001023358.2 Uncharacterized protein CELE_T04C4.1 [Caenorhabditis elegans]
MDYIIEAMTSSSSTSPVPPPVSASRPVAPVVARVEGLRAVPVGHRRQHSSPGHLQQFQQELHARHHHANITRLNKKRRNTDTGYDPEARPPKFKHRSPFYQSSCCLKPTDLRMLLIEAESRVLYDTATVIPTRNGTHQNASSISACGEFQFLRKRKDTRKLSQMIFGAVPNLKTNESFRIHVLEDEETILVSKTFAIPKYRKGALPAAAAAVVRNEALMDSSDSSDSQSTVKSLDGWRTRTSRSIMTTPEAFSRVRHISITFGEQQHDIDTDHSNQHFGSPSSLHSSLPRAFSPPHKISKARRRQLAVTTSLSETSAFPIPSSLKARSRMSSMSSTQADDEHPISMQNMRNIALGILVPIKQRFFLMQHIPLIEAEMSRFESRVVTAALHPSTFLQNISKSWEELTETVCQLHNAPRLRHPYWLALNEKCHLDGRTLATEFCEQLAYLVRRYDRKEAGYFLSNLVTALLMHHMSWVASVASPPLHNADSKDQIDENSLFGMMSSGAPTVGYNALMAQYLEISGACGNMRSAKICVVGEDLEVLASVCSVLSFFIRCSAVQHVDNDKMWEVPTEQPFSPCDVSNSPSTSCAHQHQQQQQLKNGYQHPEETSSVAMMRRLRNNNQMDTSSTPSTSTAAALLDADVEMVVQTTTEITSTTTTTPRHHHLHHLHSVTIDRLDFPCCPTIADDADMWVPQRPNSEGLGRSMFAGPLNNYCSHFVLSAVQKTDTNMPEVYSRMFDEVRCTDFPCHRSATATPSQSTSSMCDPAMNPENVLIIADIEQLTVKVLSTEGSDEVTSPSESIVAMLEQFVGIHNAVPANAEFLVGIIEDSLAHIVGKSLTLVELVRSDQTVRIQGSERAKKSKILAKIEILLAVCPEIGNFSKFEFPSYRALK